MSTPQKINYSSPIVQRVLRLREQWARDNAAIGEVLTPSGQQPDAGVARKERSSQWQMWQKSDLSAYARDESEHSCK